MTESDRLSKEAYRAIRKGRSAEAEKILEKFPQNGYDPYPLFLSALSSLLCDHIDAGLTSVRRLRAHYPDYLPGRELDAYIKIKSAKSRDDAVVEIIELMPSGSDSRHFRKMADKIRHVSDFDSYQRGLSVRDCVRYSRYHPGGKTIRAGEDRFRESRPSAGKRRFRSLPVFIIIFVACTAGIFGYIRLKNRNHSGTPMKEDVFSQTVLPDERYPLIGKKSIEEKYVYADESDLRSDYERSRRMVKDSKYNDALLILNRIMNSNAQPGIRDRAQFLIQYISRIADRDAEMISCARIGADPILYRGTMIAVTGVVKDVSGKKGGTFVTVIPDSDKARLVEVFSDTTLRFGISERIKIEGVFSQMVGKDSRLYVEARSVEKE